MESYLYFGHHDLVSPEGKLSRLQHISETEASGEVHFEGLSPVFVGYQIPAELVCFNFKSSLAQVGLHTTSEELHLDRKRGTAQIGIRIHAIGPVGKRMLELLEVGMDFGKLFAADDRRRVHDPDYLFRMFGRSDRMGHPLLALGGMHGSSDLVFERMDGRLVAYLSLLDGRLGYRDQIYGLLPTIPPALKNGISTRRLVGLHQEWQAGLTRFVKPDEMLLVRTLPLHITTVFARVVDDLLPEGFHHTSANILQPDTKASGDIYELFGNSLREIDDIPLEFYTLEPHREHVFFADRDQLQICLEEPQGLFKAFDTAPKGDQRAAVFVVKGEQMLNLKGSDWITRESTAHVFPGLAQGARQALMVERYIHEQPSFSFLTAIENGLITSQGILLTRYFPSPVMKRLLLSDAVQKALHGIYFERPSASHGEYFSHEDRALMLDLAKFAIPVYWVDRRTGKVLIFTEKPGKEAGMFVPIDKVNRFIRATFFGIYGSNLIEGIFEPQLRELLKGVLAMRFEVNHPLLNDRTPLALVTGGGPGAMEVGNRVARGLDILSCGNLVDFRPKDGSVVNEQRENPHVEAKMTYRLEKLVERQAEFHLDFPILLAGGIGTDFEYALEEIRRKIGTTPAHPVLLFGEDDYWRRKITSRFQCNLDSGTIAGSEWVSNCFYCVQRADQALEIYRRFFTGELKIGKGGPIYESGFVSSTEL
jgi:predicted Rossmann-fold nucleotide-binding protein